VVTLFVDAAVQLLACGHGAAVGHGDATPYFSAPTPVAAMAAVQVRSVAAGWLHSLALGWDGRVYSWYNKHGQLGHGDELDRLTPTLVEGLEGVRGMAASFACSFTVTQSGSAFTWGELLHCSPAKKELWPVLIAGFEGVRLRGVCAGLLVTFAVGEEGEVFSWGAVEDYLLGHGDEQNQPSPKRIEALRSVRVSSLAASNCHALALTEDGLVYAWGRNEERAV
jgi:alpha-tubulin suppressor-like RCC1 family protein